MRLENTVDSDQREIVRLDAFAEALGLAVVGLMVLAHVPELEQVELDWAAAEVRSGCAGSRCSGSW